ncbi:hypothetical protein RJ55_04857 [Drechmeria coniospora]|nr:hypothetical protein RJ55_04857 [Drechmeria coniospora]
MPSSVATQHPPAPSSPADKTHVSFPDGEALDPWLKKKQAQGARALCTRALCGRTYIRRASLIEPPPWETVTPKLMMTTTMRPRQMCHEIAAASGINGAGRDLSSFERARCIPLNDDEGGRIRGPGDRRAQVQREYSLAVAAAEAMRYSLTRPACCGGGLSCCLGRQRVWFRGRSGQCLPRHFMWALGVLQALQS